MIDYDEGKKVEPEVLDQARRRFNKQVCRRVGWQVWEYFLRQVRQQVGPQVWEKVWEKSYEESNGVR